MRLSLGVFSLLGFAFIAQGCGSSTEDATSVGTATASASLDTPLQAMQAAAAINAVNDLDEAALVFTTIESPQVRKAIDRHAKLRIVDAPCDGGGSFDFADDGAPFGATDYMRFEFRSCVDEGLFLNGLLELICFEGEFRSDDSQSCTNTEMSFAASGTARTPFEVRDPAGEQAQFKGSFRIFVGSTATTLEQSLEARVISPDNQQEGLVVTQEFNQRREPQSASIDELSINGRIGVDYSGDNIRCNRGLVRIQTQNELTLDSSTGFVGGELLLSNAENDEASLFFSSDGSVSVLVQGATQSFSASEFAQACTFEE